MATENTIADKQRENSDGASGADRRLRNLKPWPKGVSGNPKGRPKSQTLGEAYRKALAEPVPNDPENRTFAEVIAAIVCESAVSGNIQAAREIADRTEEKNQRMLEHSVTTESIEEQRTRLMTRAVQTQLDDGFTLAQALHNIVATVKDHLALIRVEDLRMPEESGIAAAETHSSRDSPDFS
jgi:hypothetical protein